MFWDNTTTVTYINRRYGTHPHSLCCAAYDLHWCRSRDIVVWAFHIARKENSKADALSRGEPAPNEWSLLTNLCDQIFQTLGPPLIDLFASVENYQCFARGSTTNRPSGRTPCCSCGTPCRCMHCIPTVLPDLVSPEKNQVLKSSLTSLFNLIVEVLM